jgi:hypothetical protein
MSRREALKLTYLASMAWFIVCIGYILVLALRRANFHWLVILSLSGHWALVVLLLINLYIFAIFRGVGKGQKIEIEHPLTSTNYYMLFYLVTPFLGGLAGLLGMIGENRTSEFLLGVALGTLVTTLLVWAVVDPVTGLLEMLLPASRKHRIERLAKAKAERERKEKDHERLLADLLAREESERLGWEEALRTEADRLAELLITDKADFKQAEREAVDIGARAWQIGGLSCMRKLRDMAIAICRQKNQNGDIIDYITVWWDGIGSWRHVSLS